MTGPQGSTKQNLNKKGPNLVGTSNESSVIVNNIETTALLDTGSCISTISDKFYKQHLASLDLMPVRNILRIECADGQQLPYVG
jgi:hypothetical protein